MSEVKFLEKAEGREIDQEIKRMYKDFPVVCNATSYFGFIRGSIVKGSNPFYILAINEILRRGDYRTPTLSDAETIQEKLKLRSTYIDLAILLKSNRNPNSYLAGRLITQINERDPAIKLPIIIPLHGLYLTRDKKSQYGLSFCLKEDVSLLDASIFSTDGYFDVLNKNTGLPNQLIVGPSYLHSLDTIRKKRYLFPMRTQGLFEICLFNGINFGSRDGDLNLTNPNGRIILIKD